MLTGADLELLDQALGEWVLALVAQAAPGATLRDGDDAQADPGPPVVMAGRVRAGQEER